MSPNTQAALKKIKLETPDYVRLIAVSKDQPMERIESALQCGHNTYGENKLQQALEKWPHLKEKFPQLNIELHFIGHLQTNKAADAVQLFDVIQTLDREKLVDKCAAAEKKSNLKRAYFIQVNTGDEMQKSGVAVKDIKTLYEYALDKGLNVIGLMCIPPVNEPAALHFLLLKKQANKLGLQRLSMGMSSDYALAVKCGATDIRLGTTIFGARME